MNYTCTYICKKLHTWKKCFIKHFREEFKIIVSVGRWYTMTMGSLAEQAMVICRIFFFMPNELNLRLSTLNWPLTIVI